MTAEEYIKSKRIEDYPGGHLCYMVSEEDALKAVEMAREEEQAKKLRQSHEPHFEIGELVMMRFSNTHKWQPKFFEQGEEGVYWSISDPNPYHQCAKFDKNIVFTQKTAE